MCGCPEEIEDDVTMKQLTMAEYKELVRDAATLAALEGAGVDNWDGYDEAMSQVESIYDEFME